MGSAWCCCVKLAETHGSVVLVLSGLAVADTLLLRFFAARNGSPSIHASRLLRMARLLEQANQWNSSVLSRKDMTRRSVQQTPASRHCLQQVSQARP